MSNGTLSRRAALSGAAALPLVGALATIPMAAERDPIFDLIDAHRQADAAWSRLHLIADQMQRNDAQIRVYAGMTKPWSFAFNGKTTEFPAEPLYLRTHEDIDKQFPDKIERLAALHADLQRQEDAAINPELEAAEDASKEAWAAECEALQDVITTPPTTSSGLSAMLSYLLEHHSRCDLESEDVTALLETLIDAIAEISGKAVRS